MTMEPIMLFSRRPDAPGVVRLLRTLGAKVQIDGPETDWNRATVVTGRLWNKRKLIFTHDKKYYSQPNWSVQLSGMRGYFSKFPDVPSKERVLKPISTFGFALGTIPEPDFRDGDERLDIISKVAESLDAVLFLPSSLRDAHLRILLGDDGESDPAALWPQ
jgi:hypothetical protein